jgi:hypothetical protein
VSKHKPSRRQLRKTLPEVRAIIAELKKSSAESSDPERASRSAKQIAIQKTVEILLMNRRLRRRKFADWGAMIGRIEDPAVRSQTACIVWWDYFGNQVGAPETLDKTLSAYMAEWKYGADMEAVNRELLRLGYVPLRARERTRVKISEYTRVEVEQTGQ